MPIRATLNGARLPTNLRGGRPVIHPQLHLYKSMRRQLFWPAWYTRSLTSNLVSHFEPPLRHQTDLDLGAGQSSLAAQWRGAGEQRELFR